MSQIEGGYSFHAAVKYGEVYTWGRNYEGQCATGSTNEKVLYPTKVLNLQNIVKIKAGYYMLALDSSGQLWAWGDNGSGQLGVGDKTRRTVPTYSINKNRTHMSPVFKLLVLLQREHP